MRWRTSFLPVSLLTDSSGQKAVSLSDSYPTEKLCTFHVWAPTTIFVPRLQFFTQLSNADSFWPSILRPLFSKERTEKSLVMQSAVCVCENAAHTKGSLRHAPLISALTSSSAAFERDKNNHPRWGLLRWAAAYVAAWETDINRMKWSKQRRGSVWNLFILKVSGLTHLTAEKKLSPGFCSNSAQAQNSWCELWCQNYAEFRGNAEGYITRTNGSGRRYV